MEIASERPARAEFKLRALLYFAWLASIVFLAARHVFWRDEVRALSIALSGDTVAAMLRALHGEGHPAIWYLLLRGAHSLVPAPGVLPVVAALVAAAAMAILAFRSPFRPLVIALILFSAFGLFEYAVTARNYGISMLVLFAIADLYPRYRDRGILLGFLLALLCNTNVPSAFLAGGLLLFWAVELTSEEGLRWTPKHRWLLVNGLVACAGAGICFAEVFPTVHDAAVTQRAAITVAAVFNALAVPAFTFWQTAPPGTPPTYAAALGLAILIFGSGVGLLRAPAAFAAAFVVLFVSEIFYSLIYGGSYRHQALYLVFLVCLYWLTARGRGGRWPARWDTALANARVGRLGAICFFILVGVQVATSASIVAMDLRGYPYSRSRDLADLLRRENLQGAVVIGDPDFFLEALPYYVKNPIYLMREQRFGNVVRFTRSARRDLTIEDFRRDAAELSARTRRPVVIVLQHRLDPGAPPLRVEEGYGWTFTAPPEGMARFLAATRRLARLGPAVTDESYDVYVLR